MRKFINVVVMSFLLSGCAAIQEIKEDYLKTNEYDSFVMEDAFNQLKHNYLGVSDLDKDTRRKAEILAYDKILSTSYKDDYEVLQPIIDDNLTMPQAYPYIFVHFLPREEKPELLPNSYLVVFNRFHARIVYSGVFTPPKGDPLYRYHEILKHIQK